MPCYSLIFFFNSRHPAHLTKNMPDSNNVLSAGHIISSKENLKSASESDTWRNEKRVTCSHTLGFAKLISREDCQFRQFRFQKLKIALLRKEWLIWNERLTDLQGMKKRTSRDSCIVAKWRTLAIKLLECNFFSIKYEQFLSWWTLTSLWNMNIPKYRTFSPKWIFFYPSG